MVQINNEIHANFPTILNLSKEVMYTQYRGIKKILTKFFLTKQITFSINMQNAPYRLLKRLRTKFQILVEYTLQNSFYVFLQIK